MILETDGVTSTPEIPWKPCCRLGAVPLINENDTVATDGVRMGDNDRLAPGWRHDVRGHPGSAFGYRRHVYRRPDPRCGAPEFRPLSMASRPRIEAMAGMTARSDGTGGMVTKLAAAKIALRAGCRMAIASGAALLAGVAGRRAGDLVPGRRGPRRRASAGSPVPCGRKG